MGGEHVFLTVYVAMIAGSPPRGRGTLTWRSSCRRSYRAHPRVGGEHLISCSISAVVSGSPPRGRGTLGGRRRDGWVSTASGICPVADSRTARHGAGPGGLTPAWAGNTAPPPTRSASRTAHPRVGGEHYVSPRYSRNRTGSPPRGRGTQDAQGVAVQAEGLTPAWAGNTTSRTVLSRRAAAHPRVGGEHMRSKIPRNARMGSPPRGRGTREVRPALQHLQGLTPAWAGNTAPRRRTRSRTGAHPRVGGEHDGAAAILDAVAGSPPRGRGTRQEGHGQDAGAGLTPAWAGNTCRRGVTTTSCRAHPRVGGEHRS